MAVFGVGPLGTGLAAVRVRVPATSANLGPGFDALGLALAWYDDVAVEATASGLHVEVEGEGAGELPLDHRHLVVQALTAGFDALGERPPGLAVRCTNRIPQSRGLGSSAAAICAGLLAARALVSRDALGEEALLALAARLEGHPDNVAACLLGGLTIAWSPGGDPAAARAVRLEPVAGLAPVLFVPDVRSSTVEARGVLPPVVPHADAAANAGRAALVVAALTQRPDLLLAATEDRLHQEYRAPTMRPTAALVTRLRAAGVPAVVSGAGPSVLAFPGSANPGAFAGDGWVARSLSVDREGARVF